MYGSRTYGSKTYGSYPALAKVGVGLFISGVDRSGFLIKETLTVNESVNSRATMKFQLTDKAGAYLTTVGEAIYFFNNGILVFSGSIDSVGWGSGWTTGRFLTVACVNKALALDRLLVAKAYVNMTTDAIVASVVSQYLAAEGISVGKIDPGPVVTKAVYNYVPASKLMDELCNLTGYSWNVDQYGQLNMNNRAATPAPFNISDNSKPIFNFQAKSTRQNYANREWLRAGKDATSSRTESFTGDGVNQTFVLKFPVATAPTITLNGVSKTVGIRLLDTGKDWYWQKEDNTITQADTGTVLTSSDTLAVTYTGFYPLMVKVENEAEINARALVEGNTGLYERIDVDESLEDRDLATDKANGLLRKYAAIQGTITYGTYTFGLRAGQIQNIVQTPDAISGDYLISEVSIVWSVPRQAYVVQVKALSGEQLGGWQQFFKALFGSGFVFTVRENEVVLQATAAKETLSFTDQFKYLSTAAGGALSYDFLVVAGGGGGGGQQGGGGGAGGMLTTNLPLASFPDGSYAVVVGAGGNGGPGTGGFGGGGQAGSNGSNSSVVGAGLTAIGGGGGAGNNVNAGNGGSGGGAGVNTSSKGTGIGGQGHDGANRVGINQDGSGGGGAGAVGTGANNPTVPGGGAGGVGVSSSISGSAVFYAGGGGGGGDNSNPGGAGGNGGGGAGSATTGTNATANTGGGGGGGGQVVGTLYAGGNGGSGVVIIRYPSAAVTADGTGGTITHSGGYTIHTFTASGTFVTPTHASGGGTGDALSTGSDDPFTTARVSDPAQDVAPQFRVGLSRLGRAYFS